MESCAFKGCKNLVPARQNCWECGKPYCDEHRKVHERCQKFIVCERCSRAHERWCEKNLPYLGPLRIQKTIGRGPESVYVRHYKAQRGGAPKKNLPCKIGRTLAKPTARIIAQGVFTAFPGEPVVPLVIQTNNSRDLEAVIHSALEFAGKRIKNIRGTEWFLTNPEEVERVYRAVERVVGSPR